MQAAFSDTNRDQEPNLWLLHIKATALLVVTIAIALVTPFAANALVATWWPAAQSSWLIQLTLNSWPVLFGVSLAISMIKNRPEEDGNSTLAPRRLVYALRRVCERAGVTMPRILYSGRTKQIGVGVGRGSQRRGTLIWRGASFLTDREAEVVLAHEIGHIVMGDVARTITRGAIHHAVRMVGVMTMFGFIAAAMIWVVQLVPGWFVNGLVLYLVAVAILRGEENDKSAAVLAVLVWMGLDMPREVPLALLTGMAVLIAGLKLSRVCAMAYSRVTEYRADALAVRYTSPAHAADLISALDKFRQHERARVPEDKQLVLSPWWARTHPTRADRAKALGVPYPS